MAGGMRGSGDLILSQPRLSGRQGIATSWQPGNGCIGFPGMSKLPARNWYCTSGEARPSRVFAKRPIGAAPIISAPRRAKIYSRPVRACHTQLREISFSVLRLRPGDDAASEMVLQIVAHSGQLVQDIDAVPAQQFAWAVPDSCNNC